MNLRGHAHGLDRRRVERAGRRAIRKKAQETLIYVFLCKPSKPSACPSRRAKIARICLKSNNYRHNQVHRMTIFTLSLTHVQSTGSSDKHTLALASTLARARIRMRMTSIWFARAARCKAVSPRIVAVSVCAPFSSKYVTIAV